MKNVLITGGTGLVGSYLTSLLLQKGYSVSLLSRTPSEKENIYHWDLKKGEIEAEAIENADYIINLTGANISTQRWSKTRKVELLSSRLDSIALIHASLEKYNHKIKAFISASAVGFYGNKLTEKTFDETHPPAQDFLAQTCFKAEKEMLKFKSSGIRTIILRTGIVLSNQGGALPKMITPVKFGIGSAIGTGKQYVPWIHIHDLCCLYIKAIEDQETDGIYNAVAPEFSNNYSFTKCLAKVLRKPFWPINVPGFILKIVYGEMSQIILTGCKVSAEKVKKSGFTFTFPSLESALQEILTTAK